MTPFMSNNRNNRNLLRSEGSSSSSSSSSSDSAGEWNANNTGPLSLTDNRLIYQTSSLKSLFVEYIFSGNHFSN